MVSILLAMLTVFDRPFLFGLDSVLESRFRPWQDFHELLVIQKTC